MRGMHYLLSAFLILAAACGGGSPGAPNALTAEPTRIAVLTAVPSATPLGSQTAIPSSTPQPTPTPPAEFADYVDIGPGSLFLECRGSGTPTVIFEASVGKLTCPR